LHPFLPGIRALRDVRIDDLEKYKHVLSKTVYRRCRHVITENERVLAAADALRSGDAARYGQLMHKSHESLRDDYEVSCRELDMIVDLASSIRGVYGARMTGGGFGGSTVNLLSADCADAFQSEIAEKYKDATGITPQTYVCVPAQGAESFSI
jgi:galactokinase